MKNVLCVAEVCCDIIFGGLAKIPVLGEEEYCRDFEVKAGGGANTPMGLAKLLVPVSMYTWIGRDEFGSIIRNYIKSCGVAEDHILDLKDRRTVVSAVMSTVKDRCFASFMGSGENFLEEAYYDRLEKAIMSSDHVHTYVGYCLNSPILDLCKKHHKTISVDTSWTPGITMKELEPIISECIFFTPNDKEAMELTGKKSPKEALLVLADICEGTIITMGEQGSITKSGDEIYSQPCVSYGEVKDSTGAGDLFCSGLLYGFVHGMSKKESVRFASHTAGYSVTYYGGIQESFCLEAVRRGLEV